MCRHNLELQIKHTARIIYRSIIVHTSFLNIQMLLYFSHNNTEIGLNIKVNTISIMRTLKCYRFTIDHRYNYLSICANNVSVRRVRTKRTLRKLICQNGSYTR